MNQNQIDSAKEIIEIDELIYASELARSQVKDTLKNEALAKLKRLRLAVEAALGQNTVGSNDRPIRT